MQGAGYGFFCPGCPPVIALACYQPGASFNNRCQSILNTFAHEWCEYEKWRDGKVRNHRGLHQRADALIRRFENKYV